MNQEITLLSADGTETPGFRMTDSKFVETLSGQTLEQMIKERKKSFDENTVWDIFIQVVQALSSTAVNYQVAAENIYVGENRVVRLI